MTRRVSSQAGGLAMGRGCTRSARAPRVLRGLAGSLLLLSLSSAPRAVRAEAPDYRVAVLELSIDNVSDGLARQLTERVRSAVAAQSGHTLHDSRASLEQLSLASDCDSAQPACLERIARGLGVDGLVFGRLTNESGAAVAKLELFDVASGSTRGSALATLALNEADAAAVDQKAQVLTADLFQVGAASSPFARGKLSAHDAAGSEPSATAASKPSSVDGRKVAGYALLGGAVLSAGMTVLSFAEIDRAESNSSYEQYRRTVGQVRPSVRDVCDEAASGQTYGLDASSFQHVKNSCSTGRTFEVLQFIFIGSAVLSSGLSAYLLFGSEQSERPPLGSVGTRTFSVHPSVQKNGGGLGLRMRF
jgi:hypothetical protein